MLATAHKVVEAMAQTPEHLEELAGTIDAGTVRLEHMATELVRLNERVVALEELAARLAPMMEAAQAFASSPMGKMLAKKAAKGTALEEVAGG